MRGDPTIAKTGVKSRIIFGQCTDLGTCSAYLRAVSRLQSVAELFLLSNDNRQVVCFDRGG
jgi:hypothetical protein